MKEKKNAPFYEQTESWTGVKGYEDIYQVSNCGNVRSLDRISLTGLHLKGKYVSQLQMPNGYVRVNLRGKDGQVKQHYVHRLVADAFIPNPESLPQINHKDENKKNNQACNLEWCTSKYNNNYGSHRSKHILSISTQKPVIMLSKTGDYIEEFISIGEAARFLHANASHIVDCCKGKPKYKSVKGYIFKYK